MKQIGAEHYSYSSNPYQADGQCNNKIEFKPRNKSKHNMKFLDIDPHIVCDCIQFYGSNN